MALHIPAGRLLQESRIDLASDMRSFSMVESDLISHFLRSLCSFAAIFPEIQSRSAVIGSMRLARKAGKQQAIRPVKPRRQRSLRSNGVSGQTPYRIPATNPDRAKAAASPIKSPIPTILKPCLTTSSSIAVDWAPKAILTPISRLF